MTHPAVLDPRDARPLTSREISKVLCGIIGGVTAFSPSTTYAVPHVLEALRRGGSIQFVDAMAISEPESTSNDPDPPWAAALTATVYGLRGWCDPHDVETALAWTCQNIHLIAPIPAENTPN